MPSVSGPDRQFGRLALRQGGVSPDQLAECLAEQQACAAQGAAAPRLGALLLRKGYLTDEALAELLAAPDGASDANLPPQPNAPADDSRFAHLL